MPHDLPHFPWGDPVVSRAVLKRLQEPSELALAQRIFQRLASAAEPLENQTAFAYASPPPGNVSAAREAFLKAAALSSPSAKYAQTHKVHINLHPVCRNEKATATARVLRELRCDFKRCSQLYSDGSLLPLSVFVAALELPQFERIQRRCYRFSPELLQLRNEMVKEYLRIKRAVILQPRNSSRSALSSSEEENSGAHNSGRVTVASRNKWEAKQCEISATCVVQQSCLVIRWEEYERRWLQEKESHAVTALQPLVSAVAAVEAVLKSCKKQRIFPEPSATKQRICTFRAIQAVCGSVTTLANELLPIESSCLFLEASTIVLAAAIVEHASPKATRRALQQQPSSNEEKLVARLQAAETLEQPSTAKATSNPTCKKEEKPASIWDDVDLAGLVEVATVDKEDIIVYSAKQKPLSLARRLVAYFLELMRQVWEARVCLSHVSPVLATSRPFLVAALRNFDSAHASFQLLPSSQRSDAADGRPMGSDPTKESVQEALGYSPRTAE